MTSETLSLLQKLKNLPAEKSRAAGALLGAAVADAAARPLHWIYDEDELKRVLGDKWSTPEFWPESKSPFYSLDTGLRSCYNHVVMAGLEAFIRSGGAPDLDTYTQVIRRVFGEGTAWQEALTRRKEAYNPEKRLKWREPVPGPWLHGAIIHLLETGVRDEDNTEMDPFLLALPHLLLKIRDEDVVEECIKISSLITSKLDSVRTLATTVQQVMLMQESDFSTHDPVTKYVTDALDRNDTVDDVTMMEKFGKNCHLPGSYQGALYTFLKHRHDDERYAETIRSIIRGGGCNCSRANFAGALLGAEAGVESVPVSWIDQVTDIDHILAKIIDAVTFH